MSRGTVEGDSRDAKNTHHFEKPTPNLIFLRANLVGKPYTRGQPSSGLPTCCQCLARPSFSVFFGFIEMLFKHFIQNLYSNSWHKAAEDDCMSYALRKLRKVR